MAKSSLKAGKVYQHLQKLILSGSFQPGDQLPPETELSRQFGISRPTVSKAVNMLIAEGYAFKKTGMGTFIKDRVGKTEDGPLIGLLFPLLGKGEIFKPLMDHISRLSESMNFTLIWGSQNNDSENFSPMEQMADFFIKRNVNGILMAPSELDAHSFQINRRLTEQIARAEIPLVLVDADYLPWPDRSPYDLVGIDNVRSAWNMCYHFIDQGAARVDFVYLKGSSETISQRIIGYQQALLNAGVIPDSSWIHCISSYSDEVLDNLLTSGADNLLCANDDTALMLGSKLLSRGIDIPKKVRITGFDNLDAARYFPVPLTTVAQPCREMAGVIVRTMLERIKEPVLPVRNVMLKADVVVRASSL